LVRPAGNEDDGVVPRSYRLGQYLNFNLNYSGVRGTDGRFFYDVKAETRAIF
jgi:hypothetical protein